MEGKGIEVSILHGFDHDRQEQIFLNEEGQSANADCPDVIQGVFYSPDSRSGLYLEEATDTVLTSLPF